ncbi:MAG TPA: insulinase family protein [Ruminococcaceae bacterium]|nr:insulinase family protein [Oscillospiraceae bacterium]
MTEIQQQSVCGGVNFRSIKDSRFKTVRMSVNFMQPLSEATAAPNAVLPYLLTRTSRRYPDLTKLNGHLAELYGAQLDAYVFKLGDVQVLSIFASGIADKYSLGGEKVSEELSKLLCSVIFDPLFENGMFPKDGFEQERRQLMEKIDAEYNDKRTYAFLRCAGIMCKGEPYGIPRCGTKKDIENLRLENLNKVWSSLIHNAKAEIMVVGDCDPVPVYDEFSAAFHNLGRAEAQDYTNKVVKAAADVKNITEKQNVTQSKLVLGFRTGCAEPDVNVPAAKLMNVLFGGSPNSKLFLNVREKLSLCYYCSSLYDPLKGIIFVQSGVETKNIKSAQTEILKQLDEVKKGNFTDEELNAAKLSICNSYRTIADSPDGLEGWYLSKTFSDPAEDPEEEAEKVRAVTREEVIKAAGKMTLDTVYALEGSGAENK